MNYIYDILANFNNNYYEFFEWNDKDDIVHIKKLAIIKVNSDFLFKVKYHDVIVDTTLLEKIYKKTDFFNIDKNKYSYVCALCDGREAIVVRFDSKGSVIGRSSMLIDEENEVIDISETIGVSDFVISVNELNKYDNFKTRNESYINSLILQELKNLNSDKLSYLYFDCFDEKESDKDKILNRIFNEIDSNFNSIYVKIYDFLKLISINK